MTRLILSALTASLALAACATPAPPTYYQPAASPQGVGFSEYRIEPGRYRVSFHGGPGAPPEVVSDFALRRAADLALAEGYDWFRVSDRFMRGDGGHPGSQISIGVGGGNFGWNGGGAVGVGTGFNVGGSAPSLISTIEVVMGKGPKPQDTEVYDARGVAQSIGPHA
ncbi:MAG TPA: hypothetical protein VFW13_10400 [Phenylobacterium sp.]|nr:hypothetical protein [Phenylobacterium sp.]